MEKNTDLSGMVVKTITIQPYSAKGFAEAVWLGNFDNADSLGDITRLFGEEQVGLDKLVKVDLVEFDCDWWNNEVVAWGVANGNKRPICPAHLLGIAIQHPDEQRKRPIVEFGSVRGVYALYLLGNSAWRRLNRHTVEGRWDRFYLVGFVSEPA